MNLILIAVIMHTPILIEFISIYRKKAADDALPPLRYLVLNAGVMCFSYQESNEVNEMKDIPPFRCTSNEAFLIFVLCSLFFALCSLLFALYSFLFFLCSLSFCFYRSFPFPLPPRLALPCRASRKHLQYLTWPTSSSRPSCSRSYGLRHRVE